MHRAIRARGQQPENASRTTAPATTFECHAAIGLLRQTMLPTRIGSPGNQEYNINDIAGSKQRKITIALQCHIPSLRAEAASYERGEKESSIMIET